jgi:hypothetical protein
MSVTLNDRVSEIAKFARGKTRPMLFNGVVPAQGIGSVQGGAKSRKTWLTMQFAFAAAGYTEMPGMTLSGPVRNVLYLDGELDRLGFGDRTNRMLKNSETPDRVFRVELSRLLKPGTAMINSVGDLNREFFEELERMIRAESINVVTIDPWYLLAGDENNNERVARLLAAFRELQRSTQTLIVIVHHYGKDQPSSFVDVFQLGRGASSFGGFLDWVLCLERGAGSQFILHHGFRYGPTMAKTPLRFDQESCLWKSDDEPIFTTEMQIIRMFGDRTEARLTEFCGEISATLGLSTKEARSQVESSSFFYVPKAEPGKPLVVLPARPI